MKSLFRILGFVFVVSAVLSACSLNPADSKPAGQNGTTSTDEATDIGSATVVVDLSQNNPSRDIVSVDEYQVVGATVALINAPGELYQSVWVPGQTSIFTYNLKRVGSYTLTVTSWDTANHTNVTTTPMAVKKGYNYHLSISLGGVVSIDVDTLPEDGLVSPEDGLVSEYLFNGNANDTSIYQNNGINHGATLTSGRLGNSNSAYNFNGSSYIDCGSNQMLDSITNELTVSFWFKTANLNSRMYILGRHDNRLEGGFGFLVHNDHLIAEFGTGALMDPDKEFYITNNYNVPSNEYVFVCMTYNRSSGVLKLNVNGSTETLTGKYDINLYSVHSDSGNPGCENLNLGRFWGWGQSYFTGSIDDFRIYNKVISDTEISNLL